MGILEIITIAAALAGLIMGIGSMLAIPKIPDPQKSPTNFNGPRSNYGDSLPHIFGTVQVKSPICIYGSKVNDASPFSTVPDGVAQVDLETPQYSCTLDLLLCERMVKNGATLGSLTWRRIWYGKELLWERTGAPLTISTSLLEADPNRYDYLPDLPGGVTDQYTRGSGWWYGGIIKRSDGSVGGSVLGGIGQNWNGIEWTTGFGLEKVRLYVGNGAEVVNAQIVSEVFGTVADTDPAYKYPTYSKFARIVFEDFIWGPEPGIDEISVEITVSCPAPEIGDFSGIMSNGLDVNPISVLYQLLTCPDFCGSVKLPTIDTVSFSAARATVATEQLGMSYRLQAAIKANDLVETILSHVDAMLYREPLTGAIVITLNRPTADSSLLPSFNEENVIADGIKDFSKSTYQSTYAQARIGFELRAASSNGMYAKSVAVAQDPGLASSNELVETLEEESATAFTPAVAQTIAGRKLAIANTPLIKMDVAFTREKNSSNVSPLDLRPGDLFNFAYEPWGIANITCRVLSSDHGSLTDNSVLIRCIQDRFVPASVVTPPTPSTAPPSVQQKPDVTITKFRAVTAPYPVARIGIVGDARKALTTGSVYGGIYPTSAGFNLDRWLLLARRPYKAATRFAAAIRSGLDGSALQQMSVPYTNHGQLTTAIAAADGGQNVTFSQTVTSGGASFTIGGLYGDEVFNWAVGAYGDGRNMLLIDDEWFLVTDFTFTSNSITVTGYDRMIWDSPGVANVSTGKPSHSIGADCWLFNFKNADTAAKLSQPFTSNSVNVFLFSSWAPATPDELFYGTGPNPMGGNGFGPAGAMRYDFMLQNIDPSKNNKALASPTWTLTDRANRMLPPRRIRLQWQSGATGDGFDKTVISVPAATTSIVLDLANTGFPSSNCAPFQPREFGNLVKRFNSLTEPVEYFEENTPTIEGFRELLWNPAYKYGNSLVTYRVAGGALQIATSSGDSKFTMTVPATAVTQSLEMFFSQCYMADPTSLVSGMQVGQRSQVRKVQVNMTRP